MKKNKVKLHIFPPGNIYDIIWGVGGGTQVEIYVAEIAARVLCVIL